MDLDRGGVKRQHHSTPRIGAVKLGSHNRTGEEIFYHVELSGIWPEVVLPVKTERDRAIEYPAPITLNDVKFDKRTQNLFQNFLIDMHRNGECFPGTKIPLSTAGIQIGYGGSRSSTNVVEAFLGRTNHSYGPEHELLRLFEAILWACGWRVDREAAEAARTDFLFGRCDSVKKSEHWIKHPLVKVFTRNPQTVDSIDHLLGGKWLDSAGNLVIKGAMKSEVEATSNENKKRRIEQ